MKLDACYNWPTCSDAAVARAVELDAPDGKPLKDDLHGRRPACPVYVNDGDACDLSRWKLGRERRSVRAAGRASHLGARPRPGRPHAAQRRHARRRAHPLAAVGRDDAGPGMALRRPQRRARRRECDHLQLTASSAQQIPNPGPAAPTTRARTDALLVGHAGDAYGLRSGLWIDRERGVGIAYFVTGVPEDRARNQARSAPPRPAPSAAPTHSCRADRRTTMRLNYAIKFVADMDRADRLLPRQARARAQVRVALLDRVRDRRDDARAPSRVGRQSRGQRPARLRRRRSRRILCAPRAARNRVHPARPRKCTASTSRASATAKARRCR